MSSVIHAFGISEITSIRRNASMKMKAIQRMIQLKSEWTLEFPNEIAMNALSTRNVAPVRNASFFKFQRANCISNNLNKLRNNTCSVILHSDPINSARSDLKLVSKPNINMQPICNYTTVRCTLSAEKVKYFIRK